MALKSFLFFVWAKVESFCAKLFDRDKLRYAFLDCCFSTLYFARIVYYVIFFSTTKALNLTS